jgi:hypothetical protein
VVSAELVVPAASVARVVRRNYLLAATPGNIILRIVVAHLTENAPIRLRRSHLVRQCLAPGLKDKEEEKGNDKNKTAIVIALHLSGVARRRDLRSGVDGMRPSEFRTYGYPVGPEPAGKGDPAIGVNEPLAAIEYTPTHGQGVPPRFLEYGQEIGAARA